MALSAAARERQFSPMPYPRQHSPLLRSLGHFLLRLAGWRFENAMPELPKLVLIVAPHTSNWDFPVGVAAKFALDLRANWLGKHTLFTGPFGWLFHRLGGIPVDRAASVGMVESVAQRFRDADAMALAIAPEGTRKYVHEWRTGFQRIARAAGAPIVPVWFDYSRRVIGFGAPFTATDDVERDVRTLRALYRAEMARVPAQFATDMGGTSR